MRRLIDIMLGLLLIYTCTFAIEVQATASSEQLQDNDENAGQGVGAIDRELKVEGFMKITRIVHADSRITAKLNVAKNKMKVLRQPKGGQVDIDNEPQTIDEAAEYLGRHVGMAFPPAVCTEQDGIFYFSGGKSTEPVEDFSSGFAIRKGEKTILTWDEAEDDK